MDHRVTCLCLTRNRRQWLPQAIACFLSQTYEDKELLIVADGDPVGDLIPREFRYENSPIQLVRCLEGMTVGEKRNFGCERASGSLIAIWDDDDFSARGRLTCQVRRLQDSGVAVTGYRSMPFTDGSKWWMYQGEPGFAIATSLVFQRAWWEKHPFQPLQVGQDELFAKEALRSGQLLTLDDEGLMYATIHAGNTSPRNIGPQNRSFIPMTEGWSCKQANV